MKVLGHEITDEQCEKAFAACPSRMSSIDLIAALGKQGVPYFGSHDGSQKGMNQAMISSEGANRLFQRLRKAGRIERGPNRTWIKTGT
jgi:hypothetical protein